MVEEGHRASDCAGTRAQSDQEAQKNNGHGPWLRLSSTSGEEQGVQKASRAAAPSQSAHKAVMQLSDAIPK